MAKTLSYEFQRQPNYYYCGPAAVRAALTARDIYRSQDVLAQNLGTTRDGTNSSHNVVSTLNTYITGAVYYPTFIGGNDASDLQREQFRQDVKASIDAGYALVTNVVGWIQTNDGYTYSYPGGHYVTVVGYDDNDNVLVADVNVREYWVTTSRMATWIAGRGYSSARVAVAPAPPPVAPRPDATSTMYLIDLASHQQGLDLAAAKASGVSIVNIKTSEGATYVNPLRHVFADQARALGLGIMSFHWVDSSTDGVTQARRAFQLHQEIGAAAHQADVEDDSSWEITRDYVNEFQRLLGRKVILYTGDWWWQARGWPGSTLTPYLMAAANVGYLGSYPGDDSGHWNAGYGGWDVLSALQFAVTPIPGFGSNVSRTMIRSAVWADLSGQSTVAADEEDDMIWLFSTSDKTYKSNGINYQEIPGDQQAINDVVYWLQSVGQGKVVDLRSQTGGWGSVPEHVFGKPIDLPDSEWHVGNESGSAITQDAGFADLTGQQRDTVLAIAAKHAVAGGALTAKVLEKLAALQLPGGLDENRLKAIIKEAAKDALREGAGDTPQ